jgi:hypothetical protein
MAAETDLHLCIDRVVPEEYWPGRMRIEPAIEQRG